MEATLGTLPKPSGFERLLPIGDPWLDSWEAGNPVADLSRGVVRELLGRDLTDEQRDVAEEMLRILDESTEGD